MKFTQTYNLLYYIPYEAYLQLKSVWKCAITISDATSFTKVNQQQQMILIDYRNTWLYGLCHCNYPAWILIKVRNSVNQWILLSMKPFNHRPSLSIAFITGRDYMGAKKRQSHEHTRK